MKIAITGGSGFIGRAVTRQLQQQHDIVWLTRHQQTAPIACDGCRDDSLVLRAVDYNDVASLAVALDDCDAVIHLVGILHETAGADFDTVHRQLPIRVVEASIAAGIRYYLHLSALGASPDGPSRYLSTKYFGEKAVCELAEQHGMDYTVLRPSIVFGDEDNFFNQFARLLRFVPVIPLACPNAQLQPVHVDDIAKVCDYLLKQTTGQNPNNGKIYELGGREVVTLYESVQRVCRFYGWRRWIIPLPDTLSRWQAKMMTYLPNTPMTDDNYLSLQKPNVTTEDPWATFGITPQAITLNRLW